MQALLQPLSKLGEYEEIKNRIEKNRGILQLAGCIDSQKAHVIYGLGQEKKNRLVIAENELKAKELYEDLKFYYPDVFYYPARDLIFFEADIHGNLLTKQRMQVIAALLEKKSVTVVTSISGCMDYLLPISVLKKHVLHFKNDSVLDTEALKKELINMGFEYNAQAEAPGQFAMRGGIVDIFLLTEENPVRIEMWGDEIDSIRSFDAESQRSIENLDEITIYPAEEMVLDDSVLEKGLVSIEKERDKTIQAFRDAFLPEEAGRIKNMVKEAVSAMREFHDFSSAEHFIRYFYKEPVTFLDYFEEEDTLLFLDETNHLLASVEAVETEFRESMKHRLEKGYLLAGQTDLLCGKKLLIHKINQKNGIGICTMEQQKEDWQINDSFYLTTKSVNSYNNSFELLVKDLKNWKKRGYQVLLLSGSRTRAKRLAQDLLNEGLTAVYTEDRNREIHEGEIVTTYGYARSGFEYPMVRFVLITESDIFGKEKKKKRKKTEYSGKKIQSFSELSIGDYVVHENHGLGIYRGIEKVTVDKVVKDYIKIEYAGNSNLYILATQLDLLQKYA